MATQKSNLPKEVKETLAIIPELSGSYQYYDKDFEIIYVGKAKKLKNRVSSYFRSVDKHTPKVYRMVENVWDFETGIVVFLGTKGVITPPSVSIPNVKGVTSRSTISLTSPAKTPA